MTHYLLSAHGVEGEERPPMTQEQMSRMHDELGTVEKEMRSAGAWVFSAKLHEPSTATVVRVSGGDVLTTDGPFAEAKEYLGGFYIIQAPDLDAALGWASKVAVCIQIPIEVRPFADIQA